MNRLCASLIVLLFSAVMPLVTDAQCTDSAGFRINVPYCFGTSAAAAPLHKFAAYGATSASYTVTLITKNAGGCADSMEQTVTVQQRPDAGLADLISNFNNCPFASPGNPAFTITVTNTSTTNA